jgi:hypothetical protein
MVALGRPWNNQSTAVYQNTYMVRSHPVYQSHSRTDPRGAQSDIVLPAGFIVWSASDPRVFPNVTHFAEYNSKGPGYVPSSRNTSLETILTKSQAEQYSLESVFGGRPSWIDYGTAQGLA